MEKINMNEYYNPELAAQIHAERQKDEKKIARKKAEKAYAWFLSLKDGNIRQEERLAGLRGTHNHSGVFQNSFMHNILRAKPLPSFAFWGVGSKQEPNKYDFELLSDLHKMSRRSAEVIEHLPGADLTLILADTHGVFNGHIENNGGHPYESSIYLQQIDQMASSLGISTMLLSDLYANFALELPNPNTPISPQSESYDLFYENGRHGESRRDSLVKAAIRNHVDGLGSEQAALLYVEMRLQERQMLVETFPNSIMFVNARMSSKPLLPEEIPKAYSIIPPSWFNDD